ncbi:MAG TPA: hypothetical protein VGP72_30745 [Planctomycetota bacterium]|jgi:hypothetical protein
MAIPTHYIKKRDLLHSEKTPKATLSKIGREFLSLERFSDALDFFEKAQDRDGIEQIKRVALDRGDTFLLARLDRLDRAMVTREDWERAAQTAELGHRESMALFVKRKLAPPPGPAATEPQKEAELPGEAPLSEV